MLIAKSQFNKSQYGQSIENYTSASQIWLGIGNGQKYLECQGEIGRAYLSSGKYTDAIQVLNTALEKSASLHCDSLGPIGVIYSLLGFGYYAVEEFLKAEQYALRGITLCENTFGYKHEKTASGYYVLGTVKKAQGDYKAALLALQSAKEIQAAVLDTICKEYATTTFNIATIYDDKNDFDQALQYYFQALTIFEMLGKATSTYTATCHLYMMSCFNNKGDYRTAIEHGKKVIEIFNSVSLPEHSNVASAYAKLGEMYLNLGDFEKGREYSLRAFSIISTRYPELKSAAGDLRLRLAEIYSKSGEHAKAIEYAEKGIMLYQQVFAEYHPQIGFRFEQAANVYRDAKNLDTALKYYRKAIAARETVNDTASRNDIAALYSSIASVFLQQKQFDSAMTNLQRAFSIEQHSKEKNIPQSALLQRRFGDLYFSQKQYLKALGYYQKSIELLTSSNTTADLYAAPSVDHSYYKKELLLSVEEKARTFEMMYRKNRSINDLHASLVHYQTACDVVDDARKQYSADASKIFFAEKSSSMYRQACRVAVTLFEKTKDPRYKEEAFRIADRSKANMLLEKLFDGEAKSFAGIPDSLLNYERELQRSITYYETQILHAGEKSENSGISFLPDLQAKHFELSRSHQQFIELLEQQYPKYYELKYSRYSLSLAQVQKNIAPASAIVEYMIDDSVIYAFTVTNKTLSIRTITNSSTTGDVVQQFSAALKTYNAEAYCSSGYMLYSTLIDPLKKEISSSTSITFIPDGYLYYVPFEALPMERCSSSQIDFTKLQYLISSRDVTYSYSAAFDLKMNERTKRNTSDHLSFAGFAPVFRDSIKNGDFFANRSYVEESGIGDMRSITVDGKKFNELRYSEDELLSIGKTFNRHSLQTKNFLNTDATEKNFKEFCRDADIVHIATHGFFNERNPKLSAIIFSQPKEAAADDDGILYVDETFNLDLNAKLVVLSSCESGVGKLVDGEGMIALSRGLFYAGAQNIIYSLWKVSDKQTYLLMDEFYKNVVSGKSYSSSLRSAKLSLISSKESAFPSKWSGFVLVGN